MSVPSSLDQPNNQYKPCDICYSHLWSDKRIYYQFCHNT